MEQLQKEKELLEKEKKLLEKEKELLEKKNKELFDETLILEQKKIEYERNIRRLNFDKKKLEEDKDIILKQKEDLDELYQIKKKEYEEDTIKLEREKEKLIVEKFLNDNYTIEDLNTLYLLPLGYSRDRKAIFSPIIDDLYKTNFTKDKKVDKKYVIKYIIDNTSRDKLLQDIKKIEEKKKQEELQQIEEKQKKKIVKKKKEESQQEPEEKEQEEQEEQEEQKGEGIIKGGLYNYEIEKIMKPFKDYLGCYANDQIDILIKYIKDNNIKKGGAILNTNNLKDKEGHWVAIWFDTIEDCSFEYYDPFGNNPKSSYLINKFKQLFEDLETDCYIKVKINKIKAQSITSNNCGWYSIKYILERANSIPYKITTKYKKISNNEKDIKELKQQYNKFGFI
jgi:hypothetical protein